MNNTQENKELKLCHDVFIKEKEELEKKSIKNLGLAVKLFIIAIIIMFLTLFEYGFHQKPDKKNKTYDATEEYISMIIEELNPLVKDEKIFSKSGSDDKSSKNVKKIPITENNNKNELVLDYERYKKELKMFKTLRVIERSNEKELFFFFIKEMSLYLFFLLLSFSGSVVAFISYRSGQKKYYAILKDIDQYQRFELAEKQCSKMEEEEKQPEIPKIYISSLKNKISMSEKLWNSIGIYEEKKLLGQNDDEQEEKIYEKNLAKVRFLDEEIYLQISRLKPPQKKSVQVRADLIKAIYTYKREDA